MTPAEVAQLVRFCADNVEAFRYVVWAELAIVIAIRLIIFGR